MVETVLKFNSANDPVMHKNCEKSYPFILLTYIVSMALIGKNLLVDVHAWRGDKIIISTKCCEYFSSTLFTINTPYCAINCCGYFLEYLKQHQKLES